MHFNSESDFNAYISNRWKEQRTKNGLTQKALADAMGVQQKRISQIETGRSAASAWEVYQAISTYEIPIYDLLGSLHMFDSESTKNKWSSLSLEQQNFIDMFSTNNHLTSEERSILIHACTLPREQFRRLHHLMDLLNMIDFNYLKE